MELDKNEKKKLNDDLKRIEKPLESDQHNPKLLYEKGLILEKLGNYRSAYTAYSMAYTYDPEMVMASNKMTIIEPKLDELRKREYKSIGEFLDKEKITGRQSNYKPSKKFGSADYTTENRGGHNKSWRHNSSRRFYAKNYLRSRKVEFSNKFYKFLFYKRGLIASVIISIILTVLLRFNFVLVSNYHNSEFLLGTYGFFVDFIMILSISLIINWRDRWANLISAFAISALFGYIKLPNNRSAVPFLEVSLLLFAIFYLSTLLGNITKIKRHNRTEQYVSYSIKTILIVMSIIMIASLVTNNVTLSSLNSAVSSFSNISSASQTQASFRVNGYAFPTAAGTVDVYLPEGKTVLVYLTTTNCPYSNSVLATNLCAVVTIFGTPSSGIYTSDGRSIISSGSIYSNNSYSYTFIPPSSGTYEFSFLSTVNQEINVVGWINTT